MSARVEVDQRDLTRLGIALRAESDGVGLRRDLVAGLKTAAEPAAAAARTAILSMRAKGDGQRLVRSGPSLRQSVAAGVKTAVRTGGRSAGVFVTAGKTGMPRGFAEAPKRLNARRWRHPVFATTEWVYQSGKPGWFDDTLSQARPAALAAAQQAMDNVATRIDLKTKG